MAVNAGPGPVHPSTARASSSSRAPWWATRPRRTAATPPSGRRPTARR